MKSKIILFLCFFFSANIYALNSRHNLIYQGRIVKPDGRALSDASVVFNVKIKNPDGSCLVYEETHTAPVVDGFFSLNLGEGVRLDGGSASFGQVFTSGTNFPSCGYTTGASDDRTLLVSFTVDGETVDLGSQKVKSVAYALESYNSQYAGVAAKIGNSVATDVLTVDGATAANVSTSRNLSISSFQKLVDLLNGTSVSESPIGLGSFTTAQEGSATFQAGQIWYNSTTNEVKYYTGTEVRSINFSGPSGGAGVASINGASNSSQSFAVGTSGAQPNWSSDVGTGVHTLNIPSASSAGVGAGLISNTDYLNFSNNIKGAPVAALPTLAGQVLRWDTSGGGQFVPNFITMNDLRSKVTGTATFPSACGAGEFLTYSSVTDSMSCSGVSASAITSGVLAVNQGGTGASSVAANLIFAGPTSGTGAPGFRSLASTDLPASITDAMWTESGGSVYRSSGNVGIGTANPVAPLDVHGAVKVGSSASTCDATLEGAIRYSSGDKSIYLCNGTSWVTLGSQANSPPNISGLTSSISSSFLIGQTKTGTLNGAVDADGDSMTYELVSPDGFTFTPNTGILAGQSFSVTAPSSGPTGSKVILVRARDSKGALSSDYTLNVSLTQPTGSIDYNTPGTYTWTVPTGVYSISIVAIGGGGSGAATSCGSGGGGGGSGYIQYQGSISVTPGASYTVTVGQGGAATSGEGNTGTGSSVGSLVSVNAGQGGKGGCSGSNGGTGGASGGNGANGSSQNGGTLSVPAFTGSLGAGAYGARACPVCYDSAWSSQPAGGGGAGGYGTAVSAGDGSCYSVYAGKGGQGYGAGGGGCYGANSRAGAGGYVKIWW